MDFKSLHYPLAVAEHQSISKAAEELQISQPALSKYIKNLGEKLNVELFERKGQKLVPTYAGKTYIYWARKILPLTENLNKIKPDTDKGTIRIACPPGEEPHVSPLAVRQFWERYPDVCVDLRGSLDPEKGILAGEYDLAIVNRPFAGDQIESQFIAVDEVIMVTSETHPIKNYAVWKEHCRFPWIDVGLLSNEILIRTAAEYQSMQLSQRLLTEQEVSLETMMYVDSLYQAVRMAAAGDGICFVPERVIRNHKFPESIARYSIGEPLTMDIFIAYASDRALSGQAQYFIALMKDFLT